MSSPRRARKVGLKRIDAALDCLRPMGFSDSLVRRTIRNLLKAYGGDAGWTFIEEGSYKLVVDTILEDVERSEKAEDAPKLLTGNELPKDNSMNDELGEQVHPAPSPDIAACSPKREKLAVQVFTPQIPSVGAYSTCTKIPETMNLVSCNMKEEISHTNLEGDLPSKEFNFAGTESPQLGTSAAEDQRPFRRRRPCYGWLSSDDEEEPDLVCLTPLS